MKLLFRIRSLAVVAALSSGLASATVITTSAVQATVGGVDVLNAYTWPNGSEVLTANTVYLLNLPKFNSNLGTLQYVTLTFASSADYSLTYTATSDGTIDGTLGVQEIMKAPNASAPTLTATNITLSGVNNIGTVLINQTQGVSTGGEVDVASGEFISASGNTKGTTGQYQFTNPADLAIYEAPGGGNFNVIFRGRSQFSGNIINGSFTIGGGAYVGGAVAVQYTYDNGVTPTPEPATMSLMGGALIGLVAFGRRLRK